MFIVLNYVKEVGVFFELFDLEKFYWGDVVVDVLLGMGLIGFVCEFYV